jgi:carbon-monoxide dehydrogenase medium subunit
VIPAPFDYHAPASIDEAIALYGRLEDAKILAGGQSLIPAARFRLAQPAALIDITRIAALRYITERDGHLAIGALTHESELERSAVVQKRYPLLADTARVIADPLVRNLATVGGNLAHADPANDHPATMLAFGAELVARGAKGERRIPIDAFFVDLFQTSLQPGEILTEIRIPSPASGSGGAYIKIERKVGDYAVSAAAVQLTLEDAKCKTIRIGLTNVNPVPMRATDAEALLVGKELTDATVAAAAEAAGRQCSPSPDLRGSVEYKRDLTRVITARAIRKAAERAKGGKG